MILIVGGSGVLGGLAASRLLAAGTRVRVMSRAPARVESLRRAGAEVVQGDLVDRSSVVRACEGAEAVVSAAHSLFGRGRYASVHVDGRGHRQLFDIAKAAGVRHVVYVSAYQHDPAFSAVPFFRIKLEVERYLQSTGVSHTILRPTAFMDHHAHVLIGERVLAGKTVVLFGRGEQPRNFVAAADVAQVVDAVVRDRSLAGAIVEVAGPDNVSNMDVVRLYERVGGKPARVTHLPPALARVMSPLVRPVHPGVAQILQLAAMADTADERVDVERLKTRVPLPLTRLEDWVSQRVGASR